MQKKPIAKARAICVGMLCGTASLAQFAMAQEAGGGNAAPKASFSVVPRVSLTETWTDNARLTSAKQSEQITEVSPGLRADFNHARLKGFFDYALSGLSYAQSSSTSRSANALSSNLKLEAVDNTFFVDATGSISQQAVSAFGTQSVSSTSVNANNTEVSTYSVSPYVQGRIGNTANYLARYSRSVTNNGVADSASSQASVGFKGGSSFKSLGWSADANRQELSYSAGRTTTNDTLTVGLNYAITPQISVSAQGGSESNNFTSLDTQTNALSGVGFNWSPLNATRVSATTLHHSYGDTYQLSLDHRTGRTVWRYANSKSVTQTPNQQGTASLGTAYDLYFAQFASIQPDPVARAQLVNAYLQSYGIAPSTAVLAGFSASSLTMQRQQQLSFALLGVRDSITVIASQTDSNRLDALTLAVDDFSTASAIRQQSLSVNFAHRLSPDYSLSLLVSQVATTGSLSAQSNTLNSLNLSLAGKVGRKSTMTLGLRQVQSDGALTSYSETAVTGAFQLQF